MPHSVKVWPHVIKHISCSKKFCRSCCSWSTSAVERENDGNLIIKCICPLCVADVDKHQTVNPRVSVPDSARHVWPGGEKYQTHLLSFALCVQIRSSGNYQATGTSERNVHLSSSGVRCKINLRHLRLKRGCLNVVRERTSALQPVCGTSSDVLPMCAKPHKGRRNIWSRFACCGL